MPVYCYNTASTSEVSYAQRFNGKWFYLTLAYTPTTKAFFAIPTNSHSSAADGLQELCHL